MQEIGGILNRTLNQKGYTYALLVNVPGVYTDVRGKPVALTTGDVWKFGETSKSNRYTGSDLKTMIPGGGHVGTILLWNPNRYKNS